MPRSGVGEFLSNLLALPRNLRDVVFRHGMPVTDRARSQSVFSSLFLHVHTTRTHRYSFKPSFTLGLGLASVSLFVILCVTGILLMVYYKPSSAAAYDSIKDIIYIVPGGRLIRNVHRWAAHLMVATVILHMARVFYTNSYKRGREFNWLIGMVLFILTLALSFTGYLLPWDQLGYWASTIGANIASSPNEVTDALGLTGYFDIGRFQKQLMLGANTVGEDALIRFYWLHCIVLPLGTVLFLGVHFWRIRKDGGMTRPDAITPDELKGTPVQEKAEQAFPTDGSKTYTLMGIVEGRTPAVSSGPEHTVPSWPHLFYAEWAVFALVLAIVLAVGLLFDAPLKEPANPAVPENPAKAPWYFLGLQEMVSYSAFMGGIGIPALVVMGLGLIPFLDREDGGIGRWFGGTKARRITLKSFVFAAVLIVGMLAFTVHFGWLRNWFPSIPQIIITLVNPGSLFAAAFALWSFLVMWRCRSTRLGAVALFTCFLVGFIILTYFATVHRGPNWTFYWTKSQWPVH